MYWLCAEYSLAYSCTVTGYSYMNPLRWSLFCCLRPKTLLKVCFCIWSCDYWGPRCKCMVPHFALIQRRLWYEPSLLLPWQPLRADDWFPANMSATQVYFPDREEARNNVNNDKYIVVFLNISWLQGHTCQEKCQCATLPFITAAAPVIMKHIFHFTALFHFSSSRLSDKSLKVVLTCRWWTRGVNKPHSSVLFRQCLKAGLQKGLCLPGDERSQAWFCQGNTLYKSNVAWKCKMLIRILGDKK